MGNPKFPRKKYATPLHPWKEERIKTERELIKKYGLKNHKEVWKAKTFLGRYRQQARELLAKMGTKDPQITKESDQLLFHLTRIGILAESSSLDDVLALETESILSRRLQTLVYLKGLSTTPKHSRQIINHGHISIKNRKVTVPGYIVTKSEETEISYTPVSPLNELSHPARPKTDMYSSPLKTTTEEKTKELESKEKPKEQQAPQKQEQIQDKSKEKNPESDKKLDNVEKETQQSDSKKKEDKDNKQPTENTTEEKQNSSSKKDKQKQQPDEKQPSKENEKKGGD
jgi:small subunit ribosomal protein S4